MSVTLEQKLITQIGVLYRSCAEWGVHAANVARMEVATRPVVSFVRPHASTTQKNMIKLAVTRPYAASLSLRLGGREREKKKPRDCLRIHFTCNINHPFLSIKSVRSVLALRVGLFASEVLFFHATRCRSFLPTIETTVV